MNTKWESYLYSEHSLPVLKSWANRLQYFRYFRAFGGMANDGNSLDVGINYNSVDELLEIFSKLGYQPITHEIDPAIKIQGKLRQPSLIQGTQWIEQPGHCDIQGIKVFAWCQSSIFKIAIHSDYSVKINDFRRAEKMEVFLRGHPFKFVDPPKETKHYFCPRFYPQHFSKASPSKLGIRILPTEVEIQLHQETSIPASTPKRILTKDQLKKIRALQRKRK